MKDHTNAPNPTNPESVRDWCHSGQAATRASATAISHATYERTTSLRQVRFDLLTL